jgi:hypothetical protein
MRIAAADIFLPVVMAFVEQSSLALGAACGPDCHYLSRDG